jgi:hypothetical protein
MGSQGMSICENSYVLLGLFGLVEAPSSETLLIMPFCNSDWIYILLFCLTSTPLLIYRQGNVHAPVDPLIFHPAYTSCPQDTPTNKPIKILIKIKLPDRDYKHLYSDQFNRSLIPGTDGVLPFPSILSSSSLSQLAPGLFASPSA